MGKVKAISTGMYLTLVSFSMARVPICNVNGHFNQGDVFEIEFNLNASIHQY